MVRSLRLLSLFAVVASIGGFLSFIPIAGADEATSAPAAPQFTITAEKYADPGYISVELAPGSSVEIEIQVEQVSGAADTDAIVYKANAVTLMNGGFGAQDEANEPIGPTTWLEFPTGSYTLSPGETVEQSLTIAVPGSAAPGEYVSALVVQNVEPVPIGSDPNAMFNQVIRRLLPVMITVPGPRAPNAEIDAPSFAMIQDQLHLIVPIDNTGNLILSPEGEIVLKHPESGEVLLTVPVEMRPIYVSQSTTFDVVIAGTLAPGDYDAEITLADERKDWSYHADQVVVTVPDPNIVVPPDPVSFAEVTVQPSPSADDLQFLAVAANITNNGDPIANATLLFHVTRDDELVEDFPLASALALQKGTTTVSQRYLPLTGWEPGTYRFAFALESVDPSNGVATVLARTELEQTVVVP
jgi:hypothetical protein